MKSFFGDCDKKGSDPHGKIIHTNPLWTKDKVIRDMESDLQDIERDEKVGFIDARVKAKKMARKNKLEKTLRQVKDSDPRGKVKGRERDVFKTAIDSFETKIKDLNPTQYDEEQARRGLSTVNPQIQGNLSKTPCIKLENEDEIDIAKKCNMKINANNMVSRDDMTRGLWLLERSLDIEPNHLRLKKERPEGYIRKSNQVQVGDIPDDMVRNKENRKKKAELAQV